MKNLQKIGALLLCLLLLIGATACGADENANSTPNVGDNTTSSVNGGDPVSSETDDGDGEESSGMPQSGDPLTDFVGMWALAFGGRAQDSIYIKEDGTWV